MRNTARSRGSGISSVELEKLRGEQKKLARKVVLRDEFDELKLIGGADEGFARGKIISAVVVCDNEMRVIGEARAAVRDKFPYIPTFLSFREGPAIIKAFEKLRAKPDLLFVNGCGINHPRFCGLASHVGVLLNVPTIGITQNLLCGAIGENGELRYEGRVVGFAYKSRKEFNPIFIAPGHGVSLRSALEITKKFLRGHKLPEPLFLAHMRASEVGRG